MDGIVGMVPTPLTPRSTGDSDTGSVVHHFMVSVAVSAAAACAAEVAAEAAAVAIADLSR